MKSTSQPSGEQNSWSTFSGLWALGVSALGLIGLCLLRDPERVALYGVSGLIGMGIIGMWRWSWWAIHVIRSRIFLWWVFPRWRRRANQIPVEQLPPVCILVPTYKEKPWITERVFRVLALEAKSLAKPTTILVASSGHQENAAILQILKSVDPELSSIRLIQMVQTGEGKRKAMADGLRELARLNLPEDTVVALMDGDSELTEGTLRKCLP
ncbi:MAG TPA: glycosyltransferase, partial [Coleofasciculaceae cyanobacterium]